MTTLQATCPDCGLTAGVRAEIVGKVVRCPRCSRQFEVKAPTQDAPAAPPPSVPESAVVPPTMAESVAMRPTQAEISYPITPSGAAVPEIREWRIGDCILDLYDVRDVLGQGGMGRVYRVYHRGWRVDLAVKVPLPETLTGLDSFEREAETWVKLGLHPHVVSCYYIRRIDGVPRVFAEFIDGGSLHDWIRQGRLKQADLILDVAIQFAWGLHYAHEQGIVHQDVKPANVMITRDGVAKVTDFGLARAKIAKTAPAAEQTGQTVTIAGGGVGTPAYMAPEQSTRALLTRRSDVWGWALSVLEIYIGRRTWEFGIAAAEILKDFRAHRGSAPGATEMPAAVFELLTRCFRDDPNQRPHTLREAAASLQKVYEALTGRPHPRSEPTAQHDSADSLNNRAVSVLDLGRVEDAEALWNRALAAQPHHIEATYNQAVHLWIHGRLTDDELLLRMEEAQKSHVHEARAGHLAGRLHLFIGDFERAAQRIEGSMPEGFVAPEARRDLALSVCALARDARDAAQWERARAAFEAALQADHVEAADITGYALCLERLGRGAEAQTFYSRMAEKRSDLAPSIHPAAMRLLPAFDFVGLRKGLATGASVVVVARGGRTALVGEDELVHVWNLADGAITRSHLERGSRVRALAVTPDGRHFLRAGEPASLHMHEVDTGRVVSSFTPQPGLILSLSISHDGRWLVSGSSDHNVRLWDLDEKRCVRVFEGHAEAVSCVAVAPSGGRAVSGGLDGAVRAWDLVSGRAIAVASEHRGRVSAVAIDEKRALVVSGGDDRVIRVWDLESGRLVRELVGHTAPLTSLALSEEKGILLSGSIDHSVRQWDWEAGRLRALSRLDSPIHALACDRNDAYLAYGRRLGSLRLHDRPLQPAFAVSQPVSASEAAQRSIQFEERIKAARESLRDGDYSRSIELTRAARGIQGFERADDAVKLWDELATLLPRKGLMGAWESGVLEGHSGLVLAIDVSPDGTRIASAAMDATVRLWDFDARRELITLTGHAETVTSVAFTPDGGTIISGSWDRTARAWDATTGRTLRVFEGHDDYVSALSISPDGSRLLTASWDQNLRLWDVALAELLAVLEGHTANVSSTKISSDGRFAISGSWDGSVRVWDIETRECVLVLEGHEGNVTAISLSPNGRQIASGGLDAIVRLWDIRTRRTLRTFKEHHGEVTALAFTPDGRYLTSVGRDKTVRSWELGRGRLLRSLDLTAAALALAWTPNGTELVTAGPETSVRIWHFDWDPEPGALSARGEKAPSQRETSDGALLKTRTPQGGPSVRPTSAKRGIEGPITSPTRRGIKSEDRRSIESRSRVTSSRAETRRSFWDEVRTQVPAVGASRRPSLKRHLPLRRVAAGLAILAAIVIFMMTRIHPAPRPRLVAYLVKAVQEERALIDVGEYENDCSEGGRSYYLDQALANEVSPMILYCVSRHADAGMVRDYLGRVTLEDEDGDRKRRRLRNAASLLAAMGEPVVDVLCGYLGDERELTRSVVSRALLAMESPSAQARLQDALESPDPRVRVTGTAALRRSLALSQITPEKGWQRITTLLADPDSRVRIQALEILTIFGPEIAAPAAARLKDDSDEAVRGAAQQAEADIADVLRYEQVYGR